MTDRIRQFAQVDVFSDTPYLGNPVAVVLDADGMSDEQMQRLARWTNLSETTFVLPASDSSADYRLRIFTPGGELPFAGHPTLGSAHAWLEAGGQPQQSGKIIQECKAGLVELRKTSTLEAKPQLSFIAPPTVRSGAVDPELLDHLIEVLGVSVSDIVAHQWVDNGPGWVCVQLASAAQVLALEPQFAADSQLMLGVVGAKPQGSRTAFELRAFAPKIGVYEDPVTGSLNASVAQWLFRTGVVGGSYLASQGGRVGRDGVIALSQDADGRVWVGGAATTCVRGTINI